MFDAYIAFQAKLRPRSPAILVRDAVIDFGTFHDDIGRIASALGEVSVDPGQAVAIEVGDYYHCWLVCMALARRGIASAPPQDSLAPVRITDRGTTSAGRVIATPPAWFAAALARPAVAVARHRQPRRNLARVLCTSGTTGSAKRIGLTWHAVDAIIRNSPYVHAATQEGRWLPATGPQSIFGFAMSLGGWAMGNTIVLSDGLGAPVLTKYRPTLVSLVPHQLQQLLEVLPPRFAVDWPLRILSGGAPLPSALANQARSRLGIELRSVYGASECSGIALADAPLLDAHPMATGYVTPGTEVEVLDADGTPLPAGRQGEIRIRSERLGFDLDAPSERVSSIRDGWFYPGDLGRMDENGVLFLDGRIDEQMNLGGDKVSPTAIEAALHDCPGVRELVAFSVPNAAGLARCWLAIVAADGFDPDSFGRFTRERLPWIARVFWMQVDRIPRNAMGKAQRTILQDAARNLPENSG